MESIIFLSVLVGISLIAYLLGLRDSKRAEKALLTRLKKNFGEAPKRNYKQDDLDHLQGYYKNHSADYQIDDTTWNDLNMDGVFARMNYCLSATGEEYLYHMLRTPLLDDDFDSLEKKISFLQKNEDARISLQLIFSKIGRNIRYSIYDYIDYLKDAGKFSNREHYLMLVLMALSICVCFFNFSIGFVAFVVLVVINLIRYFAVKGDIEPYLASYRYILRVIRSVSFFEKVNIPELEDDFLALKKAASGLKGFSKGSSILMSQSRMNSGGNPAELILDYIRIATHIDLIKFNQMYKEISLHRDDLDTILTITGRIEAYISIACFRESFKGSFCIPAFEGDLYDAKELIHPLIQNAVANDISTKEGILITGSNASGKSTFLKTCAINTVLAQSIHTVLGKEYKAPLFEVYSSMALNDNIFEGDSYYIVEIKSIKRILDAAAKSGNRVLCFVDEVLRGTNTIERIAASTEILKTFVNRNVTCFAATHDIELTALLKDSLGIYHFEGDVTDNDVHFDYKIKSGPATNRNAIKLLGVLGYDEAIVDNAQALADKFLATGAWN
jgi:DNA mismatch repair ATPase MutS